MSANLVLQGTIFEVVLYREDNPLEIINKIQSYPNLLNWAWIIHNQDKYETDIYDVNNPDVLLHSQGENEILHYHCLFRFKSSHSLDSVAKHLELPSYRLQRKDHWRGSFTYLVHLNQYNEFKHLYSYQELHSNYHLAETPEEGVQLIVSYINGRYSYIWQQELLDYVLMNDLFKTYRSCFTIINHILTEHNFKYSVDDR